MNPERVEQLIHELPIELGEGPSREGLLKTPNRVARAYDFLTRGYRQNLDDTISGAVFESEANNMIIIRDIELLSLCEQHLQPLIGQCHIGYITTDKVIGVSKLARIMEVFSRRLQIQERLTHQIAKAVMDSVQAEGVGVVIEARHLCMMMRGVEKQGSVMTTSSVLGSFHHDEPTRLEFLHLLNRKKP